MPAKTTSITADGYVGLTAGTSTAQTRVMRVIGVVIDCGATAGSFKLLDGGSGGGTLLNIPTPASASAVYPIFWHDDLIFHTDCYADVTNCAGVVFWR